MNEPVVNRSANTEAWKQAISGLGLTVPHSFSGLTNLPPSLPQKPEKRSSGFTAFPWTSFLGGGNPLYFSVLCLAAGPLDRTANLKPVKFVDAIDGAVVGKIRQARIFEDFGGLASHLKQLGIEAKVHAAHYVRPSTAFRFGKLFQGLVCRIYWVTNPEVLRIISSRLQNFCHHALLQERVFSTEQRRAAGYVFLGFGARKGVEWHDSPLQFRRPSQMEVVHG